MAPTGHFICVHKYLQTLRPDIHSCCFERGSIFVLFWSHSQCCPFPNRSSTSIHHKLALMYDRCHCNKNWDCLCEAKRSLSLLPVCGKTIFLKLMHLSSEKHSWYTSETRPLHRKASYHKPLLHEDQLWGPRTAFRLWIITITLWSLIF